MNTHFIDLTGYYARSRGSSAIYLGTAGSHGNEQLQVKQGDGWEGLTVQVVFHPSQVAVQLPANGLLDVPWEATEKPLTAMQGRIIFQGFDQDRLVNSIDLAYTVASHSPAVGRDKKTYTPGIVEGVLNQMAVDKDAILQAAQQTGQDKEATATSAAEAAGSATAARQSADAAGTSASQAADSAAAASETLTQVQRACQEAQQNIKDAQADALDKITAAAPALPAVSTDVAWQSVTVRPNSTGYNLAALASIEATIRPTVSGNPAICENSTAWGLQGFKIYGKSIQDSTPSPENPIDVVSAGEDGNIKTIISGWNVVNTNNNDGWESNGDAIFSIKNGTINISGSSAYSCAILTLDFKKLIGYNLYIVSENYGSGSIAQIYIKTPEGPKYYNKSNNPIRIPKDATTVTFSVYANNSSSVRQNSFEYKNVGVYIEKIPDSWKPYVGIQYFSISSPNGLPGIPVESGGNYTDSYGQQWICDVIDFDAKTKTQNIVDLTSKISSGYFTALSNSGCYTLAIDGIILKDTFPMLCNKLLRADGNNYNSTKIKNSIGCSADRINIYTPDLTLEEVNSTLKPGLTAFAIASDPVTATLSAEEFSAYHAITTYTGTTVVTTAEPVAGIEVQYVADGTKYAQKVQWMESRLDTLANQILSVAGKAALPIQNS